MSELREMSKNLNDGISEIKSGCYDVSKEIEGHLKSRIDARARYDDCLDGGNVPGMNDSLRAIKEANKRIEILGPKVKIFDKKLSVLLGQVAAMKVVETENIGQAAKALETARELKKNCDEEQNICLGMSIKMDELAKLIRETFSSSGKVKVSQDDEI